MSPFKVQSAGTAGSHCVPSPGVGAWGAWEGQRGRGAAQTQLREIDNPNQLAASLACSVGTSLQG